MKTAMQELIEAFRQWQRCWDEYDKDPKNNPKPRSADEFFKPYIEKEKEQIIEAYYGNIEGVYGYREAGEKYYNQTYQNK